MKVANLQQQTSPQKVADYETAINGTGFGTFNILVLFAVATISISQVFETESMSYVAPIAQCDLNLSLKDKGLLNSIAHIGMIVTGFIWGYLSDLSGRRNVIVYGTLLEATFIFIGAISQNFIMLIFAKFFSGSIICGPFSASASLLTEFHASQYRSKIHLARGITVALGTLIVPVLAWIIFPSNININIFGFIHIHSWNFFLIVSSLIPLTAGIIFYFMPESPIFLMSLGKHEEALGIIQKVYRINTGKPEHTFPFKMLYDETQNQKESLVIPKKNSFYVAVNRGIQNMKPLFVMPYVLQLFLVCSNGAIILMGTNTFKYWLPQLMQSVVEYQSNNNDTNSNICHMIEELINEEREIYDNCNVNFDNDLVYQNSIYVSFSLIAILIVSSAVVNILGKKTMIVILSIIAGSCSIFVYYVQDVATLMVLFALSISTSQTASIILMTITLEIFPTTFRTTALSLYLTFARLGSIIGNTVFPLLLSSGCLPPFLFLSLLFFGTAVLTLLQPNTENKALK